MDEDRAAEARRQFALGLKKYGAIECGRDIGGAAVCFKSALKGGMDKSLYYLGLCALAGSPPQLRAAIRFFKRAGARGDADALRRLGLLLKDDTSYPDYGKAAHAFAAGARLGDPGCMYYYGLLLRGGVGVRRDAAAAYEWFASGAAKGDADCLTEQGRACLTGEGRAEDAATAEKLLKEAERAGSVTATALLGVIIERSDGDNRWAAQKYILAAQAGNAEGQYRLGLCFYYGRGVKREVRKAAALLEKAAAQKHGPAMAMTARLYGRGEGVPLDYQRARYAFLAASAQGEDCLNEARRMARCHRRAKAGYADYYKRPLEYERAGFVIEDDCLLRYGGKECCQVPEGIRIIRSGAFNGRLKKVTLPSSLIKAEPGAFSSAEVEQFVIPADCLCVRVRNGRLYDKKNREV